MDIQAQRTKAGRGSELKWVAHTYTASGQKLSSLGDKTLKVTGVYTIIRWDFGSVQQIIIAHICTPTKD